MSSQPAQLNILAINILSAQERERDTETDRQTETETKTETGRDRDRILGRLTFCQQERDKQRQIGTQTDR